MKPLYALLLLCLAMFSSASLAQDAPEMLWADQTRVGRPFSKDPAIVRFGGRYLMYFSLPPFAAGLAPANAPVGWSIGIAQSDDLVQWEKKCIEAPTIIRQDGKLFMFYAGGYNNEPQQVGVAVSENGIDWERLSDVPLLANGAPGAWNSSESGHPCIFRDINDKTWLFFQGNNDRGRTWQLSRVGIEWDKGLPRLAR